MTKHEAGMPEETDLGFSELGDLIGISHMPFRKPRTEYIRKDIHSARVKAMEECMEEMAKGLLAARRFCVCLSDEYDLGIILTLDDALAKYTALTKSPDGEK